jgi:hypothetical protein
MSFSDDPIIPTESTPGPLPDPRVDAARSRRRRVTRRDRIPTDKDGQAALISELSRRAYPSFELFVFSAVCGVVLGLGFLLDSQAVLLLGVLATPLMIPWVGFLLSILTGSPRFLFETFMALVISGLLVFAGGLLMGVVVRFLPQYTLTDVYTHSRLWVPELVVIVIGAVTLVASFVRSESKPFLPSVIIAYAFYLPINAAGFGLGSGLPGIWPHAILVFIAHFALVSVFGLLTLLVLKLRPSTSGIILSVAALLLLAVILFILMQPSPPSATNAVVPSSPTAQTGPLSSPTPTPNLPPTSTSTPVPSDTLPPTETKVDLTETVAVAFTQAAKTPSPVPVTLNVTLPATDTPTITLTPEVVPIFGRVNSNEGGGANLRQTPNGKYLMTLGNDTIVEVYPDFKLVSGVTWIRIIVTINGKRVEGWLLESTVIYATPEPNFGPSSTPAIPVTQAP